MKAVLFGLLVAVVCFQALGLINPTKEFRKQLAGPPSEFATYAQPSPKDSALLGTSAWLPVDLKKAEAGGWSWADSFPVDSDLEFSITVFCNQIKDLKISVQPPGSPMTVLDDQIFDRPDAKGKKIVHDFGIGLTKMEVTTYVWPEPITGFWNFEIRSDVEIDHPSEQPEAYLLLGNESPIQIATHLNTYDLQVGQEVGLVARVLNVPEGVEDPIAELAPMQGVVISAEMDMILPNGREFTVQMKDDGVGADLAADDGVYTAVLEATQVGTYVATCLIKGRTPEGTEFIRTTLDSFSVVSPDVTLTGLASADFPDEREVLQFDIDVDSLDQKLGAKVRAYAEVWGTDNSGLEYLPIAWIQAMVDVEQKGNREVITMELNKKWIQLAKAQAPFQLRNVEIQEPNTNNPLSQRKEVFVQIGENELKAGMSTIDFSVVPEITEEMRKGPRPASLRRELYANEAGEVEDHRLMLVHGYCAGANEFPPSQFTSPYIFKDFGQSKSNDMFALTIKEHGDQFTSFSIVGHSQAGLASLHLLSYYWSAFDVANGGRLIQSVGSPYQGTSLAGFLADLGGVFGLGCGSNYDLSRSGAANWLCKIPLDVRKDVFYYTTQYDDYWWLLSNNCVTASNLVLHKPNDGTTEKRYGQLPGANAAGHKKAWCHTSGMKYAPQCTDAQRNKEMNDRAAR